MNELQVSVEPEATEADRIWVQTELAKSVINAVGQNDFQSVNVFLRDPEGKLLGGLLGWTVWSWLHIDSLWIEEVHRRKGYGSKLLAGAEDEARRRACNLVEVDTFDFQALGFYEKAGYEVFGVLPNIKGRIRRYYLRKSL